MSCLLRTVAVCLSLAGVGCLQATEPIHKPVAASQLRPSIQSVGPASPTGSATAGQANLGIPRGLFPLAIGNWWRYSFTSAISGPEVPGGRVVWLISTGTIELVGRMQVGPFEYVEARSTTVETIPATGAMDTLVGSIAYREGFDGLYEIPNLPQTLLAGCSEPIGGRGTKPSSGARDLSPSRIPFLGLPPILRQNVIVAPSSSSPPNPIELKLLSYPLHQGATWTVAYPLQATVEGVEVLDLPIGRLPAYRVRTFLPGFEDQIQSWWSRCGLLKERRYRRLTCLDPICPPPDTFAEDILTVEQIHLVGLKSPN
jgi:hypothetical protein